ncbi:MAG: S8 family peptidase [Chloroflexi bacterium]|nr:S8 family peptidase [Chloroflexota bacterium]
MARKALLAVLITALFMGLIGAGVSASSPEMVEVIVAFDHEPGPAEEALIAEVGGEVKHSLRLIRTVAARIPAAALQRLRQNPGVVGIEEDSDVFSADIELDNSWGVNRIAAGVMHDAGNKGTGVKIAVIDSGIDYNHPDLAANYAGGYDFVNDDDDPMDDNGHGTHVAGVIAAIDDDVGVVGVAPEVRLYALKVLNATGRGRASDVIAAVEWCIANGIQITNNSYGRYTDPGPVYKAAFDKAYAAGILNIASAGNRGNALGFGDTVSYPATLDSVVAVAAVDTNDIRPSWSGAGPDIEVAAPGVRINSTLPGGGYGVKSGTSMAAPHVAGLAALIIAGGIADSNGNGNINDEVRERLTTTAADVGTVGRDALYGYGIARAGEAAPVLVAPTPSAPGDVPEVPPDSGGTINEAPVTTDLLPF